jgi:hypothetical protein
MSADRRPIMRGIKGDGIAYTDPEVGALQAVSALLAHFGDSLPSGSTVGAAMLTWSTELNAAAEERCPAAEVHAGGLRPV